MLARSIERNECTRHSIDQVHRLGILGFDGSTNLIAALSWLTDIGKIPDEGM